MIFLNLEVDRRNLWDELIGFLLEFRFIILILVPSHGITVLVCVAIVVVAVSEIAPGSAVMVWLPVEVIIVLSILHESRVAHPLSHHIIRIIIVVAVEIVVFSLVV